jgi:hypothetical protein
MRKKLPCVQVVNQIMGFPVLSSTVPYFIVILNTFSTGLTYYCESVYPPFFDCYSLGVSLFALGFVILIKSRVIILEKELLQGNLQLKHLFSKRLLL